MSLVDPKRQRSVGVDLARLFGLAAIVAGHVWSQSDTLRWLYTWHVPLFFMLSGFVWSDRRTLWPEAEQRTRRLLVPYASWLALLILALVARGALQGSVNGAEIGNALWGGARATRPFTTLWFITTLFAAVILCKLVRRLPAPGQAAAGALGLLGGYLWGPELAATPLSIGMALPCLFYLLVGIGLRWLIIRLRPATYLAVPLIAVAFLAIALGWNDTMDMKNGDLGTPVLGVVVAICITAGLVLVAERAAVAFQGLRPRALVTRATEASLVLVLTHPAVLWVLDTPSSGGVVDFILALVAPLALGLGLLRTPLAEALTGQPRRRTLTAAPDPV